MTKACHEIALAMHTDGQQVMYYRNVVYLHTCSSDDHLMSVAGRAKLQYSGKVQIQKRPAKFRRLLDGKVDKV